VPLEKVFRGSMPFLWALVLAAVLLVIFPSIATFLPAMIK
jgi:TRAP-type C4-dicarboxylate transport system permease large subunit